MEIQRVPATNEWGEKYGFSRVVRAGNLVFVNGTAPVADDGSTFAPGDAAAQTLRCFEIVEAALGELGLTRDAIMRTRMYVTDIARQDEFGRAHRAFFGDRRPCLTMLEVSALVRPDMLVEVECDAVTI